MKSRDRPLYLVAFQAFEGKTLQRWIKAVFRNLGQRNKIEMPL
jgi:hypothetical protein